MKTSESGGPLGYRLKSNRGLSCPVCDVFLGFAQFLNRKKAKLLSYALVAATIFAILYTFSRGAYLAVLVSAFILGALKDRKLLLVGVVFLLTWQLVVPNAVRQRVNMTQTANGQLEASAKERVRLWEDAEASILSDPIFGTGFATYQLTYHIDNLRDTHNWYVKVMVETGIIGLAMIAFMLQQILALAYRLFKKAEDPLYRGLGLGLFVATCSCIVANFFGDRWTYLEITGPLWVLVGAAVCASHMPDFQPGTEQAADDSTTAINPYLVYR